MRLSDWTRLKHQGENVVIEQRASKGDRFGSEGSVTISKNEKEKLMQELQNE